MFSELGCDEDIPWVELMNQDSVMCQLLELWTDSDRFSESRHSRMSANACDNRNQRVQDRSHTREVSSAHDCPSGHGSEYWWQSFDSENPRVTYLSCTTYIEHR